MNEGLESAAVGDILDRIRIEYGNIDGEVITSTRAVLCDTPQGQEFLTWLGSVLGHFSTSGSSAIDAVLDDVYKLILARCGIWHAERMHLITKALTELPPVVPEANRDRGPKDPRREKE